MIGAPRLRQYIASTGATPEIALQEVVLTYVLAALYEQPFAERLAFKGGTALRKLLYGAEGRFSVDLDFLGAATSDDEVLAIAGYLDGLDFHGVSLALGEHRFSTAEPDHFNRPSPSGFSAELSFSCIHGTGGFGLDISRRREAFLPLRRVELRPETYHSHIVEFALPQPWALAFEESAAEKVSALLRRMRHGNAKDVFDLWLYLARPFAAARFRRLLALTLWSDRRVLGESGGKLAEIQPSAFQWEELAGLLPRRHLEPAEICRAVRERLGAELATMTPDETALVADAPHHRLVTLFQRLADESPSLE